MFEHSTATGRWMISCSIVSLAMAAHTRADFSFPDFSNPDHVVLVDQAAIVGNVLRVIPGQSWAKGAAWFDRQQDLTNGFETWFRFRLSGGTGSADGFAFVLQSQADSAIGYLGGCLGYSSGPGEWAPPPCSYLDGIPQSLAIEFDTFYNPALEDIGVPHVSVHSRGMEPNCAHHANSLGATSAVPSLLAGVHTTRIRYAAQVLSVYIDDLVVPVLQVAVDLGTYPLLPSAWVGFTAGSGTSFCDTDILAWSFSQSAQPCSTPVLYCTAKPNSLGCLPQIGFIGVPSVSAPEAFTITAAQICNYRAGFLVWSHASAAVPFAGGFLCVSAPLHRTPLQDSGGNAGGLDCSGTFSFAMSLAYLTKMSVSIGDELFAQYWSRDPYALPFPVSLTDAVRFTVCP